MQNDTNQNFEAIRQTSQAQSQAEVVVAQYDLEEKERREEQIHQMVDDLGELHTMFKDLNVLVNEQQEDVNILETNVEHVREQVESGTQHVVVASEHQRAYRKKLCYVLMILLIVAVVIVIIIFGVGKNKI